MKPIDLTGQRFYRLTALRVAFAKNGGTYWRCRCDCGNEITIIRSSLISRPNVSCGCLHAEIQRARLLKHGKARSPEYVAWQAMHQRCGNPKNPEYKNYGARGITICERWATFENFFADMGNRPARRSLERIDNEKGYSPDNCKWATLKEQNDNKRQSRLITYKGKTQNLTRWAGEIGIKPATLYQRIVNSGWTIERAFTAPLHH